MRSSMVRNARGIFGKERVSNEKREAFEALSKLVGTITKGTP